MQEKIAKVKYLWNCLWNLNRKTIFSLIALLMICDISIGTAAFLVDGSEPVVHAYTPSTVACEVIKSGTVGSDMSGSIFVKNTGDTEAYIRVRMVAYPISSGAESGDAAGTAAPVGGQSEAPAAANSTIWTQGTDGCVYYGLPVAAGEQTGDLSAVLDASLLQEGAYAFEVYAEAIQSTPVQAVKEAWPQSPFDGMTVRGVTDEK